VVRPRDPRQPQSRRDAHAPNADIRGKLVQGDTEIPSTAPKSKNGATLFVLTLATRHDDLGFSQGLGYPRSVSDKRTRPTVAGWVYNRTSDGLDDDPLMIRAYGLGFPPKSRLQAHDE
jgi:hypothetical protein